MYGKADVQVLVVVFMMIVWVAGLVYSGRCNGGSDSLPAWCRVVVVMVVARSVLGGSVSGQVGVWWWWWW